MWLPTPHTHVAPQSSKYIPHARRWAAPTRTVKARPNKQAHNHHTKVTNHRNNPNRPNNTHGEHTTCTSLPMPPLHLLLELLFSSTCKTRRYTSTPPPLAPPLFARFPSNLLPLLLFPQPPRAPLSPLTAAHAPGVRRAAPTVATIGDNWPPSRPNWRHGGAYGGPREPRLGGSAGRPFGLLRAALGQLAPCGALSAHLGPQSRRGVTCTPK